MVDTDSFWSIKGRGLVTARRPSTVEVALANRSAIRTCRPSKWSVVESALPAVLMAAALLTPLLVITWHGLTLAGFTEESTGYRYFYSLRYLYTADERPWVPQGQTMTLIHMVLQLLLTAAGYPVTQIHPRIDHFVWVATALPHVVTAATLIWAVRPLKSLALRLAVPAALVFVSLEGVFSWDRYLILPDYYSWIHTLALIAFGLCIRMTAPGWKPSWKSDIGIGLFIGASLGLKVTLLALVVPPVLLWLRQRSLGRIVGGLVVIGVVALAAFATIEFAAHAGSVAAFRQFFDELLKFGSAAGQRDSAVVLARYMPALAQDENPVARYLHLVPVVLVLSVVFCRNRLISAALLPGAILPLLLLMVRFTASTLVETGDCLVVVASVWCIRVLGPQLDALLVKGVAAVQHRAQIVTGAQVLVCAVLVGVTALSVNRVTWHYLREVSQANMNEAAINAFTAEQPGRVAIVTVDNGYHPYTTDSAIFKGGTNIAQSSKWGVSPFVTGMVPDRGYFSPDPDLPPPIDVSSYRYLLFVSRAPADRFSLMQATLEQHFGLSLMGFDCPLQLPNPESAGIQYGCRRNPDAPVTDHVGDLAYAPSTLQMMKDTTVFDGNGRRAVLQIGQAVLGGNTGEIWRLEQDRTFTRLTGAVGQTALVHGVGLWSERQRGMAGIEATFDGSRWRLPRDPLEAANRNTTFTMRADGTVRNWDIIGASNVTLVTVPAGPVTDGNVPVPIPSGVDQLLKVRLKAPTEQFGVRTSVGLDGGRLGSPISALVRVRPLGEGEFRVRLHSLDKSAMPGPEATVQMTRTPDAWRTVRLQLEPEQILGSRVELTIEMVNPGAGAALDLESAEIVIGRYPW